MDFRHLNAWLRDQLWQYGAALRRPTQKDLASGSYQLKEHESGMLCTNEGAAGAVTFNLPANPRNGCEFYFYVLETQNLTIDPGATKLIKYHESGTYHVTTAAEDIQANAQGEWIWLRYDGTSWQELSYNGTWTAV